MQLAWFDRRHLQLLLEMQANERDSLNIGLYMLDKNLTGTLTCHSQALGKKLSRVERERGVALLSPLSLTPLPPLVSSGPDLFTANEMPTLPVKLFQLLDVRHKNEINASDMQQVRCSWLRLTLAELSAGDCEAHGRITNHFSHCVV